MGRSVLSWVCVCVLSLMLSVGCSETAGTAGTSGDGGAGGDGGAAGMGDGGDGGHGGAAAQEFPCTEQGLRDAIALGGGPHTFDCDGPTTITIRESLVAETDLILDGQGDLTLDGGGLGSNASLELRGLAFSNLKWAITVAGSLTLIDSRVTDSEQGAIYGGLRGLAIRNTIISGAGSTAIDFLGPGPGTIEYSAIEGNLGGGISNQDRAGCGQLTIRNTTVSGNGGTGLSICGDVTISNSTVSGNSGEWAVAFVGCDDRLRMTNSTVAGDVRIDGYCSELYPVMAELSGVLIQGSCRIEGWADVISLNYNIESPGNTCDFDQLTDQVNVTTEALALGPLTHNGGPTETKALLPGSVAIDAIPPEMCEADKDQRGVARPQGAACDVGAFEREVAP